MLRWTRVLACGLVSSFVVVGCQSGTSTATLERPGWNTYGVVDGATGIEEELDDLEGGEAGVIVEGEIVEVCAEKGCWMRVREGDDEIFVRFKDYAFFVPRNAAGRRVRLHGETVLQEMPVDELRHYAEDAGASAEEIAAITEPETRVFFFADSVAIEGDGLDEPHRQ
ncbi:MAG: DUF4920 domain-containing protein [Phycisphaerales bacterium]